VPPNKVRLILLIWKSKPSFPAFIRVVSGLLTRTSVISNALISGKDEITNALTQFMDVGEYNNVKLVDLFDDGNWVNYLNIPVLKTIPRSQVNDLVELHVNCAVVNWSWHQQRVWVMSYPMTQDECKLWHISQKLSFLFIN
jgi:hypothetical protein